MSRFRIISKLGAGGFGEAFRAWDSQYGVPVVLKRPLAKHLQRPDVLARFDREINRLSELTHPHIVPIIDHGHDSNGLPYLAMRFLPAGSLADRKKPHPVSFLHRWLPSIAAALDYVHGRGIVHRDVKPANIFFDTESQAYLGDFGIAKVVDEDLAQESEHSLTSTGGEIGTYPYMGPEFFYKPRVLSGVYDQYALAVTVYEMICGRRPFSGDSGQLIVAHVTQTPPDVRSFSPDAPASLCDAILRALAKKPTERFPTCTVFAEAALQDVSRVSRDESFRRFLCPRCHRLVKVPTELSGRSCRCPDCSALLRVSEKLDALWLKEEDPSSVDAPPQSAKDFRSSGNVGLSAPDGATLQRWLLAQENASSVPGTAEDGPAEGLEQRPEPSVAWKKRFSLIQKAGGASRQVAAVKDKNAADDRTYQYQTGWRAFMFLSVVMMLMSIIFGTSAISAINDGTSRPFRASDLGWVMSAWVFVSVIALNVLLSLFCFVAACLVTAKFVFTRGGTVVVCSDSVGIPGWMSRNLSFFPMQDMRALHLVGYKQTYGRHIHAINANGKTVFVAYSQLFKSRAAFDDFVVQVQSRSGLPITRYE